MDIVEAVLPPAASPDAGPIPGALFLVPVRDAVLLPGMIMPLAITGQLAAAALQEAARTEQHVVVVLQREPFAETLDLDELYAMGTEARLLRYFTGRDGTHHVILQGIGRIRLTDLPKGTAHPTVTVDRLADFITGLLDLTPVDKQQVLDTIELLPRQVERDHRHSSAAGAIGGKE